jgi:hypothetical protein
MEKLLADTCRKVVKIYTTAGIVIGKFDDLIFIREPDKTTGFVELVVKKVK